MSYSNAWNDLVSEFGFGYVDDPKQYEHIVKSWAYRDMQPRTIKDIGNYKVGVNKILDVLTKELYDFVINQPSKATQKDFDDWHGKVCNKFLTAIQSLMNTNKIQFGKAQKIVNVSLKYIYCLKGADKYVDKFKYCHMILDSYTFSGNYKKSAFYTNEVVKRRDKRRWSNLDEAQYITVQEEIRDFLNPNKNKLYVDSLGNALTPFQAEFYIFNKYH